MIPANVPLLVHVVREARRRIAAMPPEQRERIQAEIEAVRSRRRRSRRSSARL
jgi:hypothetical protein